MMRSFLISVRSEIIFDHFSVLHDKPDALEFGYVGYGVARNRDQIRKISRLDGANLVMPSSISAVLTVMARIASRAVVTQIAQTATTLFIELVLSSR